MNYLRVLAQGFLGLSILGLLLWVVARFRGPIFRVSYEGFFLVAVIGLSFVAAISQGIHRQPLIT